MDENVQGHGKGNGAARPPSTAAPIRSPSISTTWSWSAPAARACAPSLGASEAGLKTACITKVFPTRSHTVAAQGGIAASLGNMGAGRLALAHVRHRQRVGLARRPGRHRISLPQRAGGRLRARALGRAVLAHRGRQDLPAALRRHDHAITARASRSAPAPPPTAPATPCCTRCTARRSGIRPSSSSSISRIDLLMDGGACRGVVALCLDDGTLHRFRAHKTIIATGGYGRVYLYLHRRAHADRRRQRHGVARRPAAAGHGVRAVPSDRHLRRRHADHRGRARRGRLPHQFRGRALHGALRAFGEGPRLARRRLARHDAGDPRGPGRRHEARPHPPASRASRSGGAARAPAGHLRDPRGSSPAST